MYGSPGTMILRLSHQYESHEDQEFSLPVTLNITQLFSQLQLSECSEMSLTANQKESDIHRYKWRTETQFSREKKHTTKKIKPDYHLLQYHRWKLEHSNVSTHK